MSDTNSPKEKYEQLGRLVMQQFADADFGCDISGGWVQETAERLGIIVPELRDEDVFYVFAEGMKPQ